MVVTSQPPGAVRDAGGLAPARRRGAGPPRGGAVRQPDLLRLGLPPPRRRDQVRARHQPPLAHAGRVRGPAGGDGGAGFYAALAREYLAGADEPSMTRPTTLWGSGARRLDRRLLEHTAADDRAWDARLLRWDVLGSLGHIEGLRASGLLSVARPRAAAPRAARGRSRRWIAAGSAAAPTRRTCTPPSRRGSPAGCRGWASGCTPAARATTRSPATSGSTSRTGCSWSTPLALDAGRRARSPSRAGTSACSGRATPTSAARCRRRSGSGPAPTPRGCSTRSSRCPSCGRRVDRSPLGSAAGLRRAAAAAPRGHRPGARLRGLDRNVATVQGGRGKLEAAALFWCTQLGHEAARSRRT